VFKAMDHGKGCFQSSKHQGKSDVPFKCIHSYHLLSLATGRSTYGAIRGKRLAMYEA
jgi:hypothetical protein